MFTTTGVKGVPRSRVELDIEYGVVLFLVLLIVGVQFVDALTVQIPDDVNLNLSGANLSQAAKILNGTGASLESQFGLPHWVSVVAWVLIGLVAIILLVGLVKGGIKFIICAALLVVLYLLVRRYLL